MSNVIVEPIQANGPRQWTIFSVCPAAVLVYDGRYGRFEIPACPRGAAYASLDVVPEEQSELRDVNSTGTPIVRRYTENAQELVEGWLREKEIRGKGVFTTKNGGLPTDTDLEEAREELFRGAQEEFNKMTEAWAKRRNRLEITPWAMLAAEIVGRKDVEWCSAIAVSAPPKDCPDCAAKVPASARLCATCGYRWAPALEGSADAPETAVPAKEPRKRAPRAAGGPPVASPPVGPDPEAVIDNP